MTSIFNSKTDSNINLGDVLIYELVKYNKNGLITPDLWNKLESLKNFSTYNFKLSNQKPYFYMFNNSDKLLIFKFNIDELIIDVNKNFLIKKIKNNSICVGSVGDAGSDGDQGINGKPSNLESYKSIFTDGSFNVPINTPLNEPISIRGYNQYNKKEWDVLVNLDGTYNDPDKRFIELKFVNNRMIGKLSKMYKVKIRQRGPKGQLGKSGNKSININDMSDSLIHKDMIFHMIKRFDNIVYRKMSTLTDNCVLSFSVSNLLTNNYYLSSEITSKNCKYIRYFQGIYDIKKPLLELPQWTPLTGCYDQRRYELSDLPWNTDVPYDILIEQKPIGGGCAESYWFCKNEGGSATCTGNIQTTIIPIIYTSSESTSSEISVSTSSISIQSYSTPSYSTSSTSSSSTSSSSTSSNSTSSNSTSSNSTSSESSSSESSSSESLSTPSSESLSTLSTLSTLSSDSSSSAYPFNFPAFYYDNGYIGHDCNCAEFDIHLVVDGIDTLLGNVNLNNSPGGGSVYGPWWGLDVRSGASVQVYQVCKSWAGCWIVSDCHGDITTFRVALEPDPDTQIYSSALPAAGVGQGASLDISEAFL